MAYVWDPDKVCLRMFPTIYDPEYACTVQALFKLAYIRLCPVLSPGAVHAVNTDQPCALHI